MVLGDLARKVTSHISSDVCGFCGVSKVKASLSPEREPEKKILLRYPKMTWELKLTFGENTWLR